MSATVKSLPETSPSRRTNVSLRWGVLSIVFFITAVWYLIYENIPVNATQDTALYRAARRGKHGLVTTGGRVVVPLEWDEIGPFDDHGMALAIKQSRVSGIMSGASVFGSSIPEISGVIDRKGRQVIPAELTRNSVKFDGCDEFVGVRDKHLIVYDRQGREKLRSTWLPIGECAFDSRGLMAVHRNETYTGWMDRTGNIKLRPPEGLSAASNFSECGLALVATSTGQEGCIDSSGKLVIAPEWYYVSIVENDLQEASPGVTTTQAIVLTSRKLVDHPTKTLTGACSSEGKRLIPVEYEELNVNFRQELIRAKRPDGTFCGFDFTGSPLPLPPDLHVLHLHSNSEFLLAKHRGKYGWFTRTGEIAIPFLYESVHPRTAFSGQSFAISQKDGRWGVINAQGHAVVPFEYDRIEEFLVDLGLYVARKESLLGVLSADGKVIIPFEYTELGRVRTSDFFVGRGVARDVIFDRSGKPLNSVMKDEIISAIQFQNYRDAMWNRYRPQNLFVGQVRTPDGLDLLGVYHAEKGYIVPPVYNQVGVAESGIVTTGRPRSTSSLDNYFSFSHKTLHKLAPSIVPSDEDVCVVYDFDGNLVWRNDTRLNDILKALGLSCWGFYFLRKARTARTLAP